MNIEKEISNINSKLVVVQSDIESIAKMTEKTSIMVRIMTKKAWFQPILCLFGIHNFYWLDSARYGHDTVDRYLCSCGKEKNVGGQNG